MLLLFLPETPAHAAKKIQRYKMTVEGLYAVPPLGRLLCHFQTSAWLNCSGNALLEGGKTERGHLNSFSALFPVLADVRGQGQHRVAAIEGALQFDGGSLNVVVDNKIFSPSDDAPDPLLQGGRIPLWRTTKVSVISTKRSWSHISCRNDNLQSWKSDWQTPADLSIYNDTWWTDA